MALLTPEEINYYSPIMKPLEEREPILCAWRYHCESHKKSIRGNIISRLVAIKRKLTESWCVADLPQPGQVVILLIRSSPATSGTLIPILKELNDKKVPAFLVINKSTQGFLNHNYHRGFITVNQLLHNIIGNEERDQIAKISKSYARELCQTSGSVKFENSEEWILDGLIARESAKKVFSKAGFVMADSDIGSFEKGIFLGTAEKNIKGAIVQHGFFNERLFPIHATYHFDWGPYFSNRALEYGHPMDRSVSLGCPRFDKIERIKKEQQDDMLNKDTFEAAQRPVVLAISNVHAYDIFPKSIDSFFKSLAQLIDNGVSVAIRRHPAETDDHIYKKHLGEKRCARCVFVDANADLYETMRRCDIVYQALSAASIEAMLLGMAVLWEKVEAGNPFTDIPLLGGGIYVSSDNIVDVVKEYGEKGSKREEILARQENFLSAALVNRSCSARTMVEFVLENLKRV
jgi:hypothetical protein